MTQINTQGIPSQPCHNRTHRMTLRYTACYAVQTKATTKPITKEPIFQANGLPADSAFRFLKSKRPIAINKRVSAVTVITVDKSKSVLYCLFSINDAKRYNAKTNGDT